MKQNHATVAKGSMENGSTAGFKIAESGYDGSAITVRQANGMVQLEVANALRKSSG